MSCDTATGRASSIHRTRRFFAKFDRAQLASTYFDLKVRSSHRSALPSFKSKDGRKFRVHRSKPSNERYQTLRGFPRDGTNWSARHYSLEPAGQSGGELLEPGAWRGMVTIVCVVRGRPTVNDRCGGDNSMSNGGAKWPEVSSQ